MPLEHWKSLHLLRKWGLYISPSQVHASFYCNIPGCFKSNSKIMMKFFQIFPRRYNPTLPHQKIRGAGQLGELLIQRAVLHVPPHFQLQQGKWSSANERLSRLKISLNGGSGWLQDLFLLDTLNWESRKRYSVPFIWSISLVGPLNRPSLKCGFPFYFSGSHWRSGRGIREATQASWAAWSDSISVASCWQNWLS